MHLPQQLKSGSSPGAISTNDGKEFAGRNSFLVQ